MDRNKVIDIAKKIRGISNSYTSINDVIELLKCYCLEKGKSNKETMQFLSIVTHTAFLSECIQTALDYYEHKFEINKIFDKNNKLIKLF